MNSERLWILILALACFAAGVAGGVLYSVRLQPEPATGAFSAYEDRFSETFDLSPEAQRDLHYILDLYHRDVEELKARYVAEMEPELTQLGIECRDRIRKYVVPKEQRDEFDRLAQGSSVSAVPDLN